MAFDLTGNGGYGSGKLGNVSDPSDDIINAYAAIENSGSSAFKLLLMPISDSQFQSWDNCVGCQVLIHAVASKNATNNLLGRYFVTTITDAEIDDDDFLAISIEDNMYSAVGTGYNNFFWQAVLIPEFNTLTLHSKSVKPKPAAVKNIPLGDYDYITAPAGGVVAFKCKTLNFEGGHVDLRDAGFPTSINTTYRPNFSHESNGTLDTDLYSGAENSVTKDRLIVNAGDGACLIMAAQINCSSGSSRIGNPSTSGVQYCRGAADSSGTPANVSNLGGSSIVVVTNFFTNFTPNLIAKYRSGSGRGLARAYLAVRNAYDDIVPDEGLYALDTINNPERLKSLCNFTGFGNSSDGNHNLTGDAQKCWNSYAKVTAVSGRVYTISRVRADVEEFTDFEVGRLVMIHQSRKASANDHQDGRFCLSRITAISGSTVTIKHNFDFSLANYNVQMVVVPEFNNLTLPKEYKNTPSYWGGAGGIFAIACAGTCNLSDGKINMEGKGTFGRVVNPIISNYSMKGALPLGQGHGSVLIIAKNLIMNSSTRIGATYDGSQFGGDAITKGDNTSRTAQGGWKGTDGFCEKYPEYAGTGGSGGAGGTCQYDSDLNGGWHSNAANTDSDYPWGCQGAHILIIADSISGLNLSAISTGGEGGRYLNNNPTARKGGDGGCGYGGGGYSYVVAASSNANRFGGAGGYCGGGATGKPNSSTPYSGGGGSGFAFVYCNSHDSQNTNNLVLA